jgi:hypothetical protein
MNDLLMIMLALFNWAHKLPHTIHDQNKSEHGRTLASSFLKCSIVFSGSPALRYGESLLIHDENAQFYKPWWHCSHLNFHPWGFQALESILCLMCLKLENICIHLQPVDQPCYSWEFLW